MSAAFAQWLSDTLLATTLLCALVLVIRRPVARWFGPQLAYSLWAIPALRMILPPLPAMPVLPVAPIMPHAGLDQPVTIILGDAPAYADTVTAAASPLASALNALPDFPSLPILLVAVWLIGAAVHLGWQYAVHRRLLAELADARTDHWDGRVRIVSSPAIAGPVSLGLMNPVVALPSDDLLGLDPGERAIAIAHELAHHRRGDLWANAAAVLFAALHWFNPVVRAAWHAFRFDQEAACDATVLARADGPSRSSYARALAKAATGHPSAFASPMLGTDKIKERMTMLIQPARSKARRRVGLGLAAAGLLAALGVTATPVAAVQPAPPEAPTPPEAPVPPAAPEAPESPEAADLPRSHTRVIIISDGADVDLPEPPEPPVPPVPPEAPAAGERHRIVTIDRRGPGGDGGRPSTEVRTITGRQFVFRHADGDFPSDAEIETMVANALREARAAQGDVRVHARIAAAQAARAAAATGRHARSVQRITMSSGRNDVVTHNGDVTCAGGAAPRDIVNQSSGDDGSRNMVRIATCTQGADKAVQLAAIRRARVSLASDTISSALSAEARAAALAEIDRAIADLERDAD